MIPYSSPLPWSSPLPGPVRLVAGQPGSWHSFRGEGIAFFHLLSIHCVPGTKCFGCLFIFLSNSSANWFYFPLFTNKEAVAQRS